MTVLFSRTQPLIRYELTDRVRASADVCPDGRPFTLFDAIEGREEDLLHLAGIAIHPNVFHNVLEPIPVAAWQVVEEPDGLRVLLATPTAEVVDADVEQKVKSALERAGVGGIPVRVQRVDAIPRTALGKAPLIRALPYARADGPGSSTLGLTSASEISEDHVR